jgi:hypothetical protein
MKHDRLEMLFATVAVIISGVALLISIRSNSLTMQHNRLSVRPILQYGYTTSPTADEFLSFRIRNVGLVPAIVKEVELTYSGSPVSLDAQYLNALSGQVLGFYLYAREIGIGQVVEAGHECVLFRSLNRGEVDGLQTQKARDFFQRLHMKITYESIYKEVDMAEFNGAEATDYAPAP